VEIKESAEGLEPEDVQTPPAGDDSGQEPTPDAQDAQDDQDNQQALNEKALKDARSEAAKYRKRLRELEAAHQAREEAELSESEKQARRMQQLEQALEEREVTTRRLALESAVAVRSNSLGIVDAEVAVALLDSSSLEFDDAGRPDPESLDNALRRLLKAKPYLKTQPPASSPANPARGEPIGETDAQRRARLYGGNSGIFDAEKARRMGGGVVGSD
jgi:hypothetical protein